MIDLQYHGTTVLCVRKGNEVVMAGDGQVTLGHHVVKNSACKLRKLLNGRVLFGFAGSPSDALILYSKIEYILQEQGQYEQGELEKIIVELTKSWREGLSRKLETMVIVADLESSFILTGLGEVLKPESEENGEACAVGSGSSLALSAAKSLLRHSQLSAEQIAYESLKIASEMCIYTNNNITLIRVSEGV